MKDKHVLIAQYAAEHFGPQVKVPGFWTLRDVWREWFGPGGTRPRYDLPSQFRQLSVPVTCSWPGWSVLAGLAGPGLAL
jgi:hypothetical protein